MYPMLQPFQLWLKLLHAEIERAIAARGEHLNGLSAAPIGFVYLQQRRRCTCWNVKVELVVKRRWAQSMLAGSKRRSQMSLGHCPVVKTFSNLLSSVHNPFAGRRTSPSGAASDLDFRN
ncbi:hypothetical protein J1614_002934 [Plenodomus biglobosus]|nr:hypothetical protein J1614_002934 [Plenodomus biglobosus]